MLENKNIVLGVCGGIAAFKSVELLRLLSKQGARVRVVMTKNAKWFVGPTTYEALSGQPVCTDLFEEGDEASIRHIDWARAADAVIVAPATANVIGKLANGIADDALTTFMLAVIAPKILCPSMNTNMYENPAVQRNLETLMRDGHIILTPDSGSLACGTVGPGRLPEPEDILDRLRHHLSSKDLAGKRVLVTAGPTREPIDPVRFVSNPSSGKMGFAIARAAEYRGARVSLISGPTALTPPNGVDLMAVETADEMARAVFEQMELSDIIIKTAAVGDYRPKVVSEQKIKKDSEDLTLNLEKTEDILKKLGQRKSGRILVGFAAETESLSENATRKMAEKNLDLIVGNLVGNPDSGFAADTNRVTFFYPDGTVEPQPVMEKEGVANLLLDRVVKLISR